MDTTKITSTFVVLMESYCSQERTHESIVTTALMKENSLIKILAIPHNGGECTCYISTEVDGMTVSCESYPMIIREFDLRTNAELSSLKFYNSNQAMDELDKITNWVKSTDKR